MANLDGFDRKTPDTYRIEVNEAVIDLEGARERIKYLRKKYTGWPYEYDMEDVDFCLQDAIDLLNDIIRKAKKADELMPGCMQSSN